MSRLIILATAAAIAVTSPALADSKGKGKEWREHREEHSRYDCDDHDRDCDKSGPGKSYKASKGNNGRGWGVGQIPPGHLKKMYRNGDRLPDGYIVIDDYDRYGLPRPRDGERYVRLDNDVYRVARDTQTVVEAIGILDRLVR